MSLKMQFVRFSNRRWVVIRDRGGMWCAGPPPRLGPSFEYEFNTFAEAITFATSQARREFK